MNGPLFGSLLACGASLFWTISPICFAAAGRRIGSFNVNLLRLIGASAILAVIAWLHSLQTGGALLRLPGTGLLWLALSGVAGLAVGDAFYLKALTMIGARRTTQMLTLAPAVSLVLAWVLLGERLGTPTLLGIGLILSGLAWSTGHEMRCNRAPSVEPGTVSPKGIVIAAIATIFHGSGAVMSRQAFLAAPGMDPVSAALARVTSAAVVLALAACVTGRAREAKKGLFAGGAGKALLLGTLAGPVIGMIFYIGAFKHAPAGVVSTLSSMSPLLIIPVVALRYRTRPPREAVLGAVVSVAGVAVMALGR
jgi:drug/metabolite transporter (DMT)-like permease